MSICSNIHNKIKWYARLIGYAVKKTGLFGKSFPTVRAPPIFFEENRMLPQKSAADSCFRKDPNQVSLLLFAPASAPVSASAPAPAHCFPCLIFEVGKLCLQVLLLLFQFLFFLQTSSQLLLRIKRHWTGNEHLLQHLQRDQVVCKIDNENEDISNPTPRSRTAYNAYLQLSDLQLELFHESMF